MFRQLQVLWLVLIALLNACGANPGVRVGELSVQDAGVRVYVDVPLLGLPDTLEGTPRTPSDATLVAPTSQNGELIVPLRQDVPAPFNGVLFNGPAVARVEVEFQAQRQRCQIERTRDLGLVVARYNADVASLHLALDTQERTANVLIESRDLDVARLNRLLESQTRASSGPHIGEGMIWAGGGFIVGAMVVGGIVIFASSRP